MLITNCSSSHGLKRLIELINLEIAAQGVLSADALTRITAEVHGVTIANICSSVTEEEVNQE